MALQKNSKPWSSFPVTAIFLISLLIGTIYPSLSGVGQINSIELNFDFSGDLERPETENEINEECIDPFDAKISFLKFRPLSFLLKSLDNSVFIPRVYYDIYILPPEILIG